MDILSHLFFPHLLLQTGVIRSDLIFCVYVFLWWIYLTTQITTSQFSLDSFPFILVDIFNYCRVKTNNNDNDMIMVCVAIKIRINLEGMTITCHIFFYSPGLRESTQHFPTLTIFMTCFLQLS